MRCWLVAGRVILACVLCWSLALPAQAQPEGSTADAGAPDAGAPDAGAPDAGTLDAGTLDAGAPDAGADADRPAAHPGETLKVYLMTMGPGDHPFFKFGHNAIWIYDEKEARSRIYNYGTFGFDDATIILSFWLGRFEYSLSRRGYHSTLRTYRRENRTVVVQHLNLTPAERLELYEFLRWNHRKENRDYPYDYYRDNCSTRVRDAIDEVIGGRLRDSAAGSAEQTYRDHTLRLTANLLPEYVILHAVMGARIDQPISRWDEMFLPAVLQQEVRKVRVPRAGGDQPLVLSERELVAANRPPPPARPPRWIPHFVAVGLACGAGLALLGRAGRRRRDARVLSGVVLAAMGLVLGFLGTAFCLLWLSTDHDVAYANENILHCAPWLIALGVLGRGVAQGRPSSTRKAFLLTSAAAVVSAVGLLLKVLPWLDQHNGQIIAFTLPVLTGAALATYWLHGATSTAAPSPAKAGEPPPDAPEPDAEAEPTDG